ncbi:uncharacterized protein LOC128877126 [Hylaeus volcanicus]|uniref:uncharacterized protein LOC128877126 n=1 Tax=Hylaeus volcanicus TaxID=313075 RepID=UPI0023B7D685|nr:uncharacterized protein LOC128877126 [Hylaeus volcanicus]
MVSPSLCIGHPPMQWLSNAPRRFLDPHAGSTKFIAWTSKIKLLVAKQMAQQEEDAAATCGKNRILSTAANVAANAFVQVLTIVGSTGREQRVLRIRLDRFCPDSLGVLAFGTRNSARQDSPHRLLVTVSLTLDRRSTHGSFWTQQQHASRAVHLNVVFGVRFSRRSRMIQGIARDPNTWTVIIVAGFELTDFSCIVLLQTIVPGSRRSQASCQCGNCIHYIEGIPSESKG